MGHLKNPAILKAVFRREWGDSELFRSAVHEAIAFDVNANLAALAKAYKRLAPVVEMFYERQDAGNGRIDLSLRKEQKEEVAA